MAGVIGALAGSPIWNWITIGIAALATLNAEKAEDRALQQEWVARTNTILQRGPDATPTQEDWDWALSNAAFEHARIQASS